MNYSARRRHGECGHGAGARPVCFFSAILLRFNFAILRLRTDGRRFDLELVGLFIDLQETSGSE
jgi:hypothetical protein